MSAGSDLPLVAVGPAGSCSLWASVHVTATHRWPGVVLRVKHHCTYCGWNPPGRDAVNGNCHHHQHHCPYSVYDL